MDSNVSLLKKSAKTGRTANRLLRLAAGAAVALALVVCGLFYAAKWWRAYCIEKRIDAYSEIIWRHAQNNALPTGLVRAVIREESGGRPRAVSPKGAKGLMQVMPVAEQEVRRRLDTPKGDLLDPEYNILIGTAYLRLLIDRFDGDLYLTLASYHMGPTRVEGLRKANPHLTSKEIVHQHAGPATVQYCQSILRGDSMRLPTTNCRLNRIKPK